MDSEVRTVQPAQTPRQSGNPILQCVGVVGAAPVFALCGAWSSGLYSDGDSKVVLGIPFALLCVILMVRKSSALLILPLIAILWPIAYLAATAAAMLSGNDYLPMGFAGLIGGLGVALAVGIAHPQLRSVWRLTGAAAVGCLAGLAFQPWLKYFILRLNSVADPLQPDRLRSGFAIWQAAVGTYVLANVILRGWGQPRDMAFDPDPASPGIVEQRPLIHRLPAPPAPGFRRAVIILAVYAGCICLISVAGILIATAMSWLIRSIPIGSDPGFVIYAVAMTVFLWPLLRLIRALEGWRKRGRAVADQRP